MYISFQKTTGRSRERSASIIYTCNPLIKTKVTHFMTNRIDEGYLTLHISDLTSK